MCNHHTCAESNNQELLVCFDPSASNEQKKERNKSHELVEAAEQIVSACLKKHMGSGGSGTVSV
jgi:hypothetical protein